jgi:hypothetical protein
MSAKRSWVPLVRVPPTELSRVAPTGLFRAPRPSHTSVKSAI